MSLVRGLFAGGLLLVASACDFSGPPDRFINEAARPPVVLETVDFSSLQAGQHITGHIPIELSLDSLAGRIRTVEMGFAGGGWSESREQAP